MNSRWYRTRQKTPHWVINGQYKKKKITGKEHVRCTFASFGIKRLTAAGHCHPIGTPFSWYHLPRKSLTFLAWLFLLKAPRRASQTDCTSGYPPNPAHQSELFCPVPNTVGTTCIPRATHSITLRRHWPAPQRSNTQKKKKALDLHE